MALNGAGLNLAQPTSNAKLSKKKESLLSCTEWGGMFALRAPGALLLDYVPPEEPPSTPLGNALRIR